MIRWEMAGRLPIQRLRGFSALFPYRLGVESPWKEEELVIIR